MCEVEINQNSCGEKTIKTDSINFSSNWLIVHCCLFKHNPI